MSLYGCHNKPRPTANRAIIVQDGYRAVLSEPPMQLYARYTTVPFSMSIECKYTEHHASDPQCAGCVHRAREVV
jgi:hypothetical protein